MLPVTGLLVLNAGEAGYGMQLARLKQGRQHFLYNSKLYVINNAGKSFFIAGPAVGSPMAVMVLEKLIALGAKRLIVYGWCGSLSDKLHIGDILLPTWALSEEGTSVHYPLAEKAVSSKKMRDFLLSRLNKTANKIVEAPIWTTDAPYRETREKVYRYGSQGILGVDMEYGALCTVALFRGVEMAAVMLVSDELAPDVWRPGFKSKSFKKDSQKILNNLMNCWEEIGG